MDNPKSKSMDRLNLMGMVEEEFDFMLSNFFGSIYPSLYRKGLHWKPPTDFYETDEQFVVILELPQVDIQDVSITYQEGILSIRGVRKASPPGERRRYHKMEIHYGPFEQKLPMPGEVDIDQLSAQYVNGFLEVRLPRLEAPEKESMNIRVE